MIKSHIQRIRNRETPTKEIIEFLSFPYHFVKANAIIALGNRLSHMDESEKTKLSEKLIDLAYDHDTQNEVQLVGYTSVKHLCIACVFLIDNSAGKELLQNLEDKLDEVDKSEINRLVGDWPTIS